jgi:hypothetical protein
LFRSQDELPMTDAGSSAPPSAKTITEHELEQCERANQTGRTPGGVRPRPVAAAQQLGPLNQGVTEIEEIPAGARAHHRQPLAWGGRQGARVRPAVRQELTRRRLM